MRLFRFVILLVAAAIVAFPAGTALALAYEPPADPIRVLSDTVERGETFDVTVNFTAPADNFTAISLNDFAPAGWNVTVSGAWSQPTALVTADNNTVEFAWTGGVAEGYDNGTNFTALYKVTVPCGAELGNYSFGAGYLMYYIGNDTTHYSEDITGDFNVTLVPPAICSTPSIDFYAAYNGTNPGNKTLELWSSTPCMLNWSLTDNADWLSENRTNGTCTDVHSPVTVSANSSGMPLGNYTANISIESPDANNSPRIVPVTLHVSLTGFLEGQVAFTARGTPPDNSWIEPFTVRVFDEGSEVPWSPINATTNNTGGFSISDLVAGSYDIGIKNATCLSELLTNVTINTGALTEVDFGTTREGDADDNDAISGMDFSLLAGAFGSIPSDGNWDARCDFDRNGAVAGVDFSLLAGNFGDTGDLLGY